MNSPTKGALSAGRPSAKSSKAATLASLADKAATVRVNFDLDREHVELNQLLKLVGLADSGGQGKAIVASGDVTVDGAVELRKTAKIRAGQIVRVGDAEIRVLGVEG